MSGKGIAARLVATQLLHSVLFDHRMMVDLMVDEESAFYRLPPSERARAQSLAMGVLRHLSRLDAVLDRYLEKSPPPKVKNALRLAAYELLHDETAAYGVVNSAVEIVRGSQKYGHLAGLVNAVARKVASEGPEIWRLQDPQPLPSWLAKPIGKRFGKDTLKPIERAHQSGARIDITLKNPDEAESWAARLNATVLPTGSLRLPARVQVSTADGFAEGDWWVQDAAAAMPARLLGDIAGRDVLDVCAAPGGKTLQLAAAGARVSALDISNDRLERVRQNLDRTKLGANLVGADILNWPDTRKFDAILLDAPCSATGTIRRHPDLPFVKAGSDMSALFQMQSDMIDAVLPHLKPGGTLVYCTCSLLTREGETQIENALIRHENLAIDAAPVAIEGLVDDWNAPSGGWRLRPDYWPELGGMDGFFMARLVLSDAMTTSSS